MAEKMTRIRLPGQRTWPGLMDWGEMDAAEMTRKARAYASNLRAQADEIDAAADAEFQVDIVRGAYVQKHLREVQTSSRV